MINLAISVLWLLIGVIVLCGVVWLVLYILRMFMPLPDMIEKMVWAVVLILCLIGVLTLLAGGGHFRLGQFPAHLTDRAVAALPAAPA